MGMCLSLMVAWAAIDLQVDSPTMALPLMASIITEISEKHLIP